MPLSPRAFARKGCCCRRQLLYIPASPSTRWPSAITMTMVPATIPSLPAAFAGSHCRNSSSERGSQYACFWAVERDLCIFFPNLLYYFLLLLQRMSFDKPCMCRYFRSSLKFNNDLLKVKHFFSHEFYCTLVLSIVIEHIYLI